MLALTTLANIMERRTDQQSCFRCQELCPSCIAQEGHRQLALHLDSCSLDWSDRQRTEEREGAPQPKQNEIRTDNMTWTTYSVNMKILVNGAEAVSLAFVSLRLDCGRRYVSYTFFLMRRHSYWNLSIIVFKKHEDIEKECQRLSCERERKYEITGANKRTRGSLSKIIIFKTESRDKVNTSEQ